MPPAPTRHQLLDRGPALGERAAPGPNEVVDPRGHVAYGLTGEGGGVVAESDEVG